MLRILTLLRRRDDRGIALPIVVGLGLIMTLLVATGLSSALSGLRQSATDQNRTGAYDAAYAGVQDYLTRLNSDAAYARSGNATSSFSSGSSFVGASTSNPAFGVGVDSPANTWAAVPNGTTTAGPCPARSAPCFRYEVDNRQLDASGIVRVRSTGRVGDSTRSIVVSLKRQGFVNYLYYTDYETLDPAISGNSDCAVYAWQASRPTSCNIQFGAADTLRGPVHSNDTISVCGATFNQLVTTANPNTPVYTTPTGCGAGVFNGGGPNRVSKIDLPETNTAMRAQARSDIVSNTGCLYTGPTVVKFLGNGQMTVWSPWTKFTNITTSTTTGSNPAKCGKPGTDAGQLGSASGATVDELSLNLLYVQTVRTGADPNAAATTASAIPSGVTCVGPDGKTAVTDSSVGIGWKFGPWSFPTTDEAAPDGWDAGAGLSGLGGTWNPALWSTTLPAYGCRSGDLFVQGTVTTQTTAASDNYVYVTGDVRAKDATEDLLGLVGNSAVLVWNPVKSTGAALNGGSNRRIDAALLSVLHTVQVQNFNVGPARGVLTLFGSLAQKFRGTVATTSGGAVATGYSKDYQYDPLLAAVSPPYFLAPSTTTFGPRLFASVPPAFNSDGSARP